MSRDDFLNYKHHTKPTLATQVLHKGKSQSAIPLLPFSLENYREGVSLISAGTRFDN